MRLGRPVRRLHPGCKHAARGAVQGLHTLGRPRLVVRSQRRAGERRQQHRSEQRAGAAPVAAPPVR